MERLAVVSDIHGNFLALESVVDDIKALGVDAVINLGDILSGPLWPKETADFVIAQGWINVAGNHDREVHSGHPGRLGLSDAFAYREISLAHRAWLSDLPPTQVWNDAVLCFHGSPVSDTENLLEENGGGRRCLRPLKEVEKLVGRRSEKVLLCGHSHLPRCVRLGSGSIVVNPGSVGLQAYEESGVAPYRVETGSPHARYAVLEGNAEGWKVEFRVLEYDWERAATKAEEEGRLDWQVALLSGFSRR